MSTALAIGAVSAVLRNILDNGLVDAAVAVGAPVKVTAIAPDLVPLDDATAPPQLNLFMYRVSPNTGYRNAALPSRDGSARLTNPPLALNLWVRNKARKIRNEFGEQLPENLDVLASALRAGHSLANAMGVVADEAPEPSKREFRRVVTDEQLGIPLDEALEVTAKRMQNTDVDQVAILALVQREAGGNTAEVLDQVTANIRARMDIRRLVKVLTAQGKFSSVVVAMVPVGIFLFLMLVNPSHLDPLFHRTVGQISSIAAILMVLLGFYVIRKIVTIEL